MTLFWLESAEFDQPFPFNYAIFMSQDLDFNEPANTHKNVFGNIFHPTAETTPKIPAFGRIISVWKVEGAPRDFWGG